MSGFKKCPTASILIISRDLIFWEGRFSGVFALTVCLSNLSPPFKRPAIAGDTGSYLFGDKLNFGIFVSGLVQGMSLDDQIYPIGGALFCRSAHLLEVGSSVSETRHLSWQIKDDRIKYYPMAIGGAQVPRWCSVPHTQTHGPGTLPRVG